MKIVECDQLAEGKNVMIGNIIFVGTKTSSIYVNEELLVTNMAAG